MLYVCSKYDINVRPRGGHGLHGYGVDAIGHLTGQSLDCGTDVSKSLVDGNQCALSFSPAIISEVDGTLLGLRILNLLGD